MRKAVVMVVVAMVLGVTVGYVTFGPSTPVPSEPDPPRGSADVAALGAPGVLDAEAHDVTVSLVRSAQRGGGGFDRLRPSRPSVYSTHHFLRVANATGIGVTNRSGTVTWLREVLADEFRGADATTALSNESHVYVRDYYDAAAALALLGEAPANRTATVHAIQRFEAADGSYCFARPRNGTCRGEGTRLAGTRIAVAALHELGYAGTVETNDTRRWLLEQWRDDATFEDQHALSRASGIAVSLDSLGVNVTDLPDYEARRAWVRDQQPAIVRSLDADRPPLVRMENYVQLRQLFGLQNETFRDRYRQRLVALQLPDGGYHVAGGSYSEPTGTAVVVELIGADGELPDGFDRTALDSFVSYYDLPTGGFAPTVRPRPTVTNSFFALGILDRFDVESAHEESLADWVADGPRIRGSGPVATYRYATLAARFGVAGPSQEHLERALSAVVDDNTSMEERYYATRLAALVNASIPVEEVATRVREARNEDGSYGTPATTATTFYAVATLDALGETPDTPNRTVSWLRQARTADGGYYLRRGSNRAPKPDVFATYLSVRALAALDTDPARPTELREWLGSLESPNGGFYVYRPTVDETVEPTLKYTYWAVVALDVLNDTPSTEFDAVDGLAGRDRTVEADGSLRSNSG